MTFYGKIIVLSRCLLRAPRLCYVDPRTMRRPRSTFAVDKGAAAEDAGNPRPFSEIPGPKPIPVLGNTWRFLPYIGNYKIGDVDKVAKRLHKQYGNYKIGEVDKVAKRLHKLYGDIVKIEGLIGRPDMVFLFDADEIEHIFRQEEKMPHRPSSPSLNYYKHVLRKELFGENVGVIAAHGTAWYNFRSKVQQVMLQPRTARLYVEAIEGASREFVKRIRSIRDDKNESPGDFLNEIHKWSLESIATVALDVRLGCLDDDAPLETQQLIDAVNIFFKNVGILDLKIPYWKLFNTPTWKKYVYGLDTIVKITSKHTNASLAKANDKAAVRKDKEPSLLERVLALDNDAKIASILALDLFLVGIDTTSNTVASVLYQLALHPDKQAALYEEIERVLPSPTDKIEAKHIDNLKYLKAVIKETLRMYPVIIANGRVMTRDTIIAGYQIPKGVQVVFHHYVTSIQDKYFPRSDEFLPERWLDGDGVRHAFASLPFGYGRRMCIGRRFAELEINIVIAKIMQSYMVEYHYEKLEYHVSPMYTPKGPLRIRFIDR